MPAVLKDALSSKKTLYALVALIAWLVGLFGFDLDATKLAEALSPLYALMFVQGIADHGKEAAKVNAAADAAAMANRDVKPANIGGAP